MAVVGHELPGVVQHGGVLRERLGWRARGRSKRTAELATKIEERAFLQTHPVYEALLSEASSLPGRPKLSISRGGNKTDAVLSFERGFSLRHMEISWSSAVISVERRQDVLSIKLNSGEVPDGIDRGHANSYAMNSVDLPLLRVWTIPDHPMEYFKERLRLGRTRIKISKSR